LSGRLTGGRDVRHGGAVGALDFLVNLGPVDRDFTRGLDPELDRIPVDRHDDDMDVVTDNDGLIEFPAQDQHANAFRG
jgi:hypothetical protein